MRWTSRRSRKAAVETITCRKAWMNWSGTRIRSCRRSAHNTRSPTSPKEEQPRQKCERLKCSVPELVYSYSPERSTTSGSIRQKRNREQTDHRNLIVWNLIYLVDFIEACAKFGANDFSVLPGF